MLTTILLLAAVQASAPEPTADSLAYFAGTWRCDGHFTPSNRPLSSILEFSVDPVTQATTKAHRDLPPATYSANETWTSARSGGYRMTIADSFSGQRWYAADGWAGDRWTWERQRLGAEPREQFVYIRGGDNAMTVEWWIARGDAPLTMGDTLACVRQV